MPLLFLFLRWLIVEIEISAISILSVEMLTSETESSNTIRLAAQFLHMTEMQRERHVRCRRSSRCNVSNTSTSATASACWQMSVSPTTDSVASCWHRGANVCSAAQQSSTVRCQLQQLLPQQLIYHSIHCSHRPACGTASYRTIVVLDQALMDVLHIIRSSLQM